jgi:hypothetical protein
MKHTYSTTLLRLLTLAIATATMVGCPNPLVQIDTANVSFQNLTANGQSNVTTTTELTLGFDADPTTLSIDHITLTGATKETLSGSGTSRTLSITGVTVLDGESVTVVIADPPGFDISPDSRSVVVNVAANPVQFTSLTANGQSNVTTTTELTLGFDADPTTLSIDHITLTGATKETLSGSGTSRTLSITGVTVLDGESVTVVIADPPGYAIAPSSRDVTISVAPTPVSFTGLTANGISNTTDTNALTLTFDADPRTLSADDITLTGASKAADLVGSGTTRTLYISAITVADGESVTVDITNPHGFVISPSTRTTPVYLGPTIVQFTGLTANGQSGVATTTELTLTFGADPTTLALGNVEVYLSKARKVALTGTGTTRTLEISHVRLGDGESIRIAIYDPPGYDITHTPRETAIWRGPNYTVGESGPSGVGIVFYVTDGGAHGLEVSPTTYSSVWSNVEERLVAPGASGTAIGTGLTNSNAIIAQLGHTGSAAKICRDYRSTEEGDWFLPSYDEIAELYNTRSDVGGIADDRYWSSSELQIDGPIGPFCYDFGSGGATFLYKDSVHRVRPVRAF